MPRSFCSSTASPTLLILVALVGCDAGSASSPETPKPAEGPAQGPEVGSGARPNCAGESQGPVEHLPVKLPGAPPVPARGADGIADLSRGINLGNALDAPSEGEWMVVLSEAHFRIIAEAGLDHVRLPVRFSAYTSATEPFTIDERIFARVDFALSQAEAHGLSVILDLHHFLELMTNPVAETPRFVAIWKQIAERYKSRPAWLKYELLNEPQGALDSRWNEIFPQALAAVRQIDPGRTVLVDSTFWAAGRSLGTLQLPDDPALVATFHMYEPILFTHQAAPWMSAEYQTRGVVFPGPPCEPVQPVSGAQAVGWVNSWFQSYNQGPSASNVSGPKSVEEVFAFVDAFTARTGRATYLGEFAALDSVDPRSRERWLRLVRDHAQARKIPWAYWDDGGMNKAFDVETGEWVETVRRALLD